MTDGSVLSKATIIDGVAATEDRDSQGEILKLSGVDIGQMTQKGYLNDNHGTGFLNTLGRITEAKKIFKQEDCDSDRQRLFWKQKQKPFLYVKGYLFDDEDHPNAKAVSAIMKGFRKMGTPMDVKFSVEGRVTERAPGGIIAQSMVKNVALTLIPANGETAAAIAGSTIQKSILADVKALGGNVEYANQLIKSLGTGVASGNRWEEASDDQQILSLIKKFETVRSLIKMAAPGYASSGPSASRTGVGALVSESVSGKIQADKKAKIKSIAKSMIDKDPGLTVEKAVSLAFKKFQEI